MIARLAPLAGFAAFLTLATGAMNLIGALFFLGLILTAALTAGVVYAIKTTPTTPAPPRRWRRQESRTVADECPDRLPA